MHPGFVVLLVVLALLVGALGAVVLAQRARPVAGRRGPQTGAYAAARRSLPVVAECASCQHFDHAGGQRELQLAVPFWSAAQSIPPWRMGRVLKKGPDGEDLPFEEQGIDPKLVSLTWDDAGLCRHHREMRFTRDACPAFTARATALRRGVDSDPAEAEVRAERGA